MKRTVKILSIDGGGIRGIIPAMVLAEIELLTGKPAAELFDLIAGTSVGGMIALGVTIPTRAGNSKFLASDLVDLLVEHGPEVFERPWWHVVTSLAGLREEKYRADSFETLLQHYFGSARLSQAKTEVLVPAYDLELRRAYFFKRYKAKKDERRDFLMRDVARATSAAPTYFEPALVSVPKTKQQLSMIDGGVFANNPALCAYIESMNLFPKAGEVCVVSLGTGSYNQPIQHKQAKNWGLANWARPIIDIVFDGLDDTVDYHLQHLLPGKGGVKRYYRFQTELKRGEETLDDVSEKNIANLQRLGRGLIEERKQELEMLAKQLVSKKPMRRNT